MSRPDNAQDGPPSSDMCEARSESKGDTALVAVANIDGTQRVNGARRRHKLRWLAVPAIIALVGFSIVLAQGLTPAAIAPSPLIGKPAPEFVLPTINGDKTLSSARLAGAVVVVNFWASWCVPCRTEARNLEAFAERYVGSGVVLVGVLYGDTVSNAREFRDEFGLTYPLIDDPDGRTAIDFGVRGVPETFIIAPDGRVMARLIGAVGPTTLDEVLQRVLVGETFTSTNDDYRTGPVPATTDSP